MIDYIPIICFVAGLIVGGTMIYIGFKLGFRASFEIRQSKEYPAEEGKGLFKSKKEAAELELLEHEDEA